MFNDLDTPDFGNIRRKEINKHDPRFSSNDGGAEIPDEVIGIFVGQTLSISVELEALSCSKIQATPSLLLQWEAL